MTTLDMVSEPTAPAAPLPGRLAEPGRDSRPGPLDAAETSRPVPDKPLPVLAEAPAWPRVFPGL